MQREQEAAMRAVQLAAQLCQAVRATIATAGAGATEKDDRSPVTVADYGSQALVAQVLSAAFPDDALLAEENSAALREPAGAALLDRVVAQVSALGGPSDGRAVCDLIDHGRERAGGRRWVLDPIDGTKGFLRGDQYAIALALIENGVIQLGVLGCPALPYHGRGGVIFAAQRGAGAAAYELDGAPIGAVHTSRVSDPSQARLAESFESAHTSHSFADRLRDALGIVVEPARLDSQAKYGLVACGGAEIYLRTPNARTPDYRERVWDHAAGWLVVTEAGGRVTDIDGAELDWSAGSKLEHNRGIVATNGLLHDAVLAAVAGLL